MIGTTAALLGLGLSGVAGNLVSGIVGSNAANQASQAQIAGTQQAAGAINQSTGQAIDFERQIWEQQQQGMAPWMAAGQGALSQLASGTAPGGALVAPFTQQFHAPTMEEFMKSPGIQAGMDFGQRAIEQSAAARGTSLGAGTLQDLSQFATDYSTTKYGDVFNQAMQQYQNAFNVFETNQSNQFNRLSSLAGMGESATSQLGQFGSQAASTAAGIYGAQGTNLANLATGAGNARASGYMGSANAWSGALGGALNSMTLPMLMSSGMLGGGGVPSSSMDSMLGLGMLQPNNPNVPNVIRIP